MRLRSLALAVSPLVLLGSAIAAPALAASPVSAKAKPSVTIGQKSRLVKKPIRPRPAPSPVVTPAPVAPAPVIPAPVAPAPAPVMPAPTPVVPVVPMPAPPVLPPAPPAATVPVVPGVKVSPGMTDAALSWTTPAGSYSFFETRREATQATLFSTAPAEATSYVFTGLSANTRYNLCVRAVLEKQDGSKVAGDWTCKAIITGGAGYPTR